MKTTPDPEVTPDGQEVIDWATRHGAENRGDVRFSAHEAFHALDLDLSDWSSDSIHDAIMELRRGEIPAAEVRARAGEWLVCAALGIPYDVDHWALIASLERPGSGLFQIPDLSGVIRAATRAKDVKAIARRILKAGQKSGPRLVAVQ